MSRRLIACGFLGMALLVAACGSEEKTSTGAASVPVTKQADLSAAPASSSAPAPPPPAASSAVEGSTASAARCTAATLSGKVDQGDAGAGNRYAKLVFTNTGNQPCTLNGYSGFQLVAGSGGEVATRTDRTTDPGPSLVTLAPGASAMANMHWSVVAQDDESVEGPCEPEAASASAIPPDETAPVQFPWTFGPVCGAGTIEMSAFYPA
ncbi:DUF4232 domain-containing protein [Umezawaea sp. Da 62-37]|uniref:DUF4232 domain-containing protein n=1 Tax=Umezawaea sp. Da 62-37 TaxID=3075927 RepID=UPI0028F7450B|nr:DUF4232 domain-containing protein [Umezawaea sp. Da 62-37]WNV82110.1 DUF4232 domain-containing protein [Umezawaea sp. Da 62-37]